MKKVLSGILIFIALTNIVGFIPLYFSALEEIKGEVKLKISDDSELEKLHVSNAEYSNPSLFSLRGDDEFSFGGRMYDYKTVKKTVDGYIFYAFEDNKESNLIDFLKAAYSSNEGNKNNKAPLGNLLKNFSKDFVGCCPKQIIMPTSIVEQISFLAANKTCTGYYRLLQNPPDRNS